MFRVVASFGWNAMNLYGTISVIAPISIVSDFERDCHVLQQVIAPCVVEHSLAVH